MFPLHEQRILNQLMTSWVQAVCERQPLGRKHLKAGLLNAAFLTRLNKSAPSQSADDICDYFGVKISMYFAWLGFYTNSMLYPAVIGFLLWILAESDQVLDHIHTLWPARIEHFDLPFLTSTLVSRYQTSQDICCVVFALFNVVWATLFLERWKRREAELAYRWGTLDTPAESLEEPRPQFRVRREGSGGWRHGW